MVSSTETCCITVLPPVLALIPIFASLLNEYLLSSYYTLGDARYWAYNGEIFLLLWAFIIMGEYRQ